MDRETERAVTVGIFQSRDSVDRAVAALRDAGFSDDRIGVLQRTEAEVGTAEPNRVEPETKHAATAGAAAGGVVGGVAGALLAGLIPGVGPVLAGGILAGVIGGAALGASGGLVRTLLDLGVPERDSRIYERQLAKGRSIVAVKAAERYAEAVRILRQAGASFVHLEERAEPGAKYRPGDPSTAPETGVTVEDPAAKAVRHPDNHDRGKAA